MDEVFEEVLAMCLDRIADGDDPAECAAEFAEFPELFPLLELADDLVRIPRPTCNSLWLADLRERLLEPLGAGVARPGSPRGR